MTRSQNRKTTHWWESELATIRGEHEAYLRRHLRALQVDHDDLVSDTSFALTKRILNNRSAFPESWFQPTPPEDEAERSGLHRLAMVILKRRIVDLFRKRGAIRSPSSLEDLRKDIADPNTPSPERKILLLTIIEVTRSILDEMPFEDRDLIALASEEAGFRTGLNPRERQRLHRIRKRLKDEIARRLGADVAELLRTKL